MKLGIIGAALVLVGLTSAVWAQPAQRNNVCREDAQRLCKDVQPGGGRIVRCLAQHESDLSGPCRERLERGKARARQFAKACKADAKQLCKGVKPGKGRIARCLAQNKDRLSPACSEEFEKARRQRGR